MIDIQKIFEELNRADGFKKIKIEESPVGIYCGVKENGLPSLAFMSQHPPLTIESTQYLQVTQWSENNSVYWSRFDLELGSARTVFYSLCVDLIKASVGCNSDEQAMNAIKNKYMIWRKMFRKAKGSMTEESYKGMFGELYFLKHYLWPKIGLCNAIRSWSGPDMTSKDYSYKDDWYEIKTISTNSNSVSISSLTQLEAVTSGHLVIFRVEQMSAEYDEGDCCVEKIISDIMCNIDDEGVKEFFIGKILAYGYDFDEGENIFHKYRVANGKFYLVDNDFPRITTDSVSYEEVIKVTYSLALDGIQKYVEDIDGFN